MNEIVQHLKYTLQRDFCMCHCLLSFQSACYSPLPPYLTYYVARLVVPDRILRLVQHGNLEHDLRELVRSNAAHTGVVARPTSEAVNHELPARIEMMGFSRRSDANEDREPHATKRLERRVIM
jgi:hypothetical protein